MPQEAPIAPGLHDLGAVVLAGGASRRMGTDKARIRVAGERLVDLQVRRLREAGIGRIAVAIGDRPDPAWPLPEGTFPVPDPGPDLGPAGGILAAFQDLPTPWLAVVAVDLPQLDVDWLRRLFALRDGTAGIVPETGGRLEPLIALYPADAAEPLRRRIRSGDLSVQSWVREGLRDGWMRTWPQSTEDAACLLNWNRPGDWTEPAG